MNQEGHSESCTRKEDEDCYHWHTEVSPFTNGGKFQVVVGSNFSDSDSDATLINVTDGVRIIDVQLIARFDRDVAVADGITTSIEQKGMFRKMLCPPVGVITNNGTQFLSLVEACCLEKALMIL